MSRTTPEEKWARMTPAEQMSLCDGYQKAAEEAEERAEKAEGEAMGFEGMATVLSDRVNEIETALRRIRDARCPRQSMGEACPCCAFTDRTAEMALAVDSVSPAKTDMKLTGCEHTSDASPGSQPGSSSRPESPKEAGTPTTHQVAGSTPAPGPMGRGDGTGSVGAAPGLCSSEACANCAGSARLRYVPSPTGWVPCPVCCPGKTVLDRLKERRSNDPQPSRLARSIGQSMRAEGIEVTDEDAEAAVRHANAAKPEPEETDDCDACGGQGTYSLATESDPSGDTDYTCEECNGTGKEPRPEEAKCTCVLGELRACAVHDELSPSEASAKHIQGDQHETVFGGADWPRPLTVEELDALPEPEANSDDDGADVIPLHPNTDPLLLLPACPVQNCDACGRGMGEVSWIYRGYGCSACKGVDPDRWIAEAAALKARVVELEGLRANEASIYVGGFAPWNEEPGPVRAVKLGSGHPQPEPLSCDVCGEDDDENRIGGKVEVCRNCLDSAGYRVDQLTHILQLFIDGGRLESLLLQCANAGIRPRDPDQHPPEPAPDLRARIVSEIERYEKSNDSIDALANVLTVIASTWPRPDYPQPKGSE